jgi:acyl carrier protein
MTCSRLGRLRLQVLDCDLHTSNLAVQGRLPHAVGPKSRTVSDLEDLVQRAISKICDVDVADVRPDASLRDLGVDSLAAAEVLVELEIALGCELPVDVLRRLDQVDTVRDIATALESSFGTERSRPLS